MQSYRSKPRTLQEQIAFNQLEEQKITHKLEDKAVSSPEPLHQKGKIRLGVKIKGDNYPQHLGVHNQKGWVILDEKLLDQHLFVLGTTGAGKSETIKRLVEEIFASTNRNVYLVDGKGDEQLANDIRSLSYKYGRGKAPVFKLGFNELGAIYDGFRGHPTDVYNRLCALIGITDVEGDAQFYADINRNILQLVCYALQNPPRDFDELRMRLNLEWLENAYRNEPMELQEVRRLTEKDLQGLAYRVMPLAREFTSNIGQEGFSIENTQCAVFSFRTQSVGDTAKRMLNFVIEDFKDVMGKRQTHPSILIIDEFGQFDNENIKSILMLGRGSKMGVILATQDVASLKNEATKKLILANTRTKILMATDFPEDVATLAGTTYQVEASIQHRDGDVTGLGSARVQHTFKVDMNEVAQLKPGQAFLIRQRYASKLQVRSIGDVEHILPQPQEMRLKAKPQAVQKVVEETNSTLPEQSSISQPIEVEDRLITLD